MAKTLGYMITFTMYGTWLQGDKRGFVKDGEVRGENTALKKSNAESMSGSEVKFGRKKKEIVMGAITEAAKRFKQKILAMGVFSKHVHIVCEYVDVPIGVIVGYYKNAGRVALQKNGFKGRVWTNGYNTKFCFDEKSLKNRIEYVEGH